MTNQDFAEQETREALRLYFKGKINKTQLRDMFASIIVRLDKVKE